MKTIEVLYPELGHLYGDYYNAAYLSASMGEAQVIQTSEWAAPAFTQGNVDVIYIGAMSEQNQEFALQRLLPHREAMRAAVEGGTVVLATGNALELFGSFIQDGERELPCLEILDFHAVRDMDGRKNCLFLGEFAGEKIVGHKGQASFGYGLEKYPFIQVQGGFGSDATGKNEGVHYKNFFGTYLMGPFLLLNPYFVKHILKILELDTTLAYEKEILEAYRFRLEELTRPDRSFALGSE
ncbi:MAG TPA: hypothetical protein IAC31_07190 [Candidatus Faecousia intestinigallinarum]|nr:hypothetical protein [Candidatus Faecousia intestinigallinarum]